MPGWLPVAEAPRSAMATAGDDVWEYGGDDPMTDVGADEILEMLSMLDALGKTLSDVIMLSMLLLAIGRRDTILSWRRTFSR